MSVTSLDLGGCPSVARADAAATLATARVLAALPDEWEVELPPLGEIAVRAVGVCDVPEDVVVLALRREGASARLCVATALASRWVDRAIGVGDLFGPARVLGPAERGVLIALLAPLLEPTGWSFALGPAINEGGSAVILRVAGVAGAGTMWLQAPAPPPGADCWVPDRLGMLRVEAGVRAPSTTLQRGSLLDLVAGDVVVFDGVAVLGSGDGRPRHVEVVVGAFRAGAQVDAEGAVVVATRWRPAAGNSTPAKAGEPGKPRKGSREMSKDVTTSPDQVDDQAVAALAAAPVEVVAELGRITLRGDEILGLAPGVVLGLRVDRTSAVSLRVGGQLWAEGELVNVDGELGVRVTRVLAR